MEHDTQPVKVYANRVVAFGWALLAALFVTVTILSTFVWPTPKVTARPWLYQEPYKTLVFALVILLSGADLVISLYWTFTPLPCQCCC
jgi:hypothetical protein